VKRISPVGWKGSCAECEKESRGEKKKGRRRQRGFPKSQNLSFLSEKVKNNKIQDVKIAQGEDAKSVEQAGRGKDGGERELFTKGKGESGTPREAGRRGKLSSTEKA